MASAIRRRWGVRGSIVALAAAYIFLWGVVGLIPLNATDLDAFFLPSARIGLQGHPLLDYSLRYAEVYPNANGPLSLLPLTAVAALAQHLGWLDNPPLRRMLVQAVFAVFPLLLVWEALQAIERLLDRPLLARWRVPVAALFALSPLLVQSMMLYGHIEHAIMLWLLLASVRFLVERRYGGAGILFGLALLTRSSVVVYGVPLVGLMLRHRRWRGCALFGLAAGATLGLGLLPFYLSDRADLVYSLFSFHAVLTVGGGSLWGLALGTPLEAFAQSYDSQAVLVVTALVTAVALALARDLDFDSPHVYALLALANCTFALFIKTLWPYYFFDGYVFISIWWIAQAGRVADWRGRIILALGLLLPAALVTIAQIVDYSISLRPPWPEERVWSARTAGLTLGFALVVALTWFLLERRRRRPRPPLALGSPRSPQLEAPIVLGAP
jgi:hypothetical protein